MSNLNEIVLNYNKESIYHELKKFYDTNPGVLYSYQDFEMAGIREFKVIVNEIRPLNDYEKNRLASELIKMLKDIDYNEELLKIDGYLTLNPIINYYTSFIKQLKALKDIDANMAEKLSLVMKKIILSSTSSEEVKLGIISSIILDISEIESILRILSIHNEYVFYVIKAYEYMKNGNDLIFEIAKNSTGYGKLFSVMALQPANCHIKDWMIKYGAENNVAVPELLLYSMASLNLLDYLENNEFNERELEVVSKAFCMLIAEYGLDYINDETKVCKKLIEIIDKKGRGIYSLYVVVCILYLIESIAFEQEKESNEIKLDKDYKEIFIKCDNISRKSIWSEVIDNEISNIELDSSLLISCIERTGYKIKKDNFELLLKRNYSNSVLYRYAFALGNKTIRKCALKVGLEKLQINDLLTGQDELNIDDLMYDDVRQASFFVIIKYSSYEDFPNEYKKLNLKALKSPVIDTRIQAIKNIGDLQDELDSSDEEIIKDAISTEIVDSIKRKLHSLLIKKETKEKVHVKVEKLKIIPHVRDIYLMSTYIAGTKYLDISEVVDTLCEDSILYLSRDTNNKYDKNAIQIVTQEGYVLGYVPREKNSILKNLLDNGKYLYGRITTISNNYEDINIKVYLSYKDIMNEIKNTIVLISMEEEAYVQ